MLSLARRSTVCSRSILSRGLASVVPSTSSHGPVPILDATPVTIDASPPAKVPVKDNHGLYAFFRQKANADNFKGEDRYESIGGVLFRSGDGGRAWQASELRLKSFRDLHTLWYVLARERNLIATTKAEAKRLGAAPNVHSELSVMDKRCRLSQTRIKHVMNERRVAYEGAYDLANEQHEARQQAKLETAILQQQQAEYKEERRVYHESQVRGRRTLKAFKLHKAQEAREAAERAAAEAMTLAAEKAQEALATEAEATQTPAVNVVVEVEETKAAATPEPEAPEVANPTQEPEAPAPHKALKPEDSVAAGLFGTGSSKRK